MSAYFGECQAAKPNAQHESSGAFDSRPLHSKMVSCEVLSALSCQLSPAADRPAELIAVALAGA